MNQKPDGQRVYEILEAYEDYRSAIVRLYQRLSIETSYAGFPDGMVAGLIVAQVIGGVALPTGSMYDPRAEVVAWTVNESVSSPYLTTAACWTLPGARFRLTHSST